MNTLWTVEETKTLRKLVEENRFDSWSKLQNELNRLHGVNKHPQSARYRWENLNGGLTLNAMSLNITPERKEYLVACWGNNFPMSKTMKGFKEQFGRTITTKQIYSMLRTTFSDKELKNMNNKDKKNDKMSVIRGRWTPKEDKIIGKSATVNHALSQGDSLKGRTVSSIRQRFYKLKKIQKAERLEAANSLNNIDKAHKLSKPKKKVVKTKTVKPTKKPKTPYQIWTVEQDYELVMNFYELSIDEACNRFNRPYGTIAKRLETIVNSTKPAHISLLMTATKEIKARKKAESKPVKVGLLARRKARKQSKKIAKSNRKIAKIEKKLNKMKGE